MASGRGDPLVSRGVNDLLFERLDIADAVHDASAELHVCRAFTSPPPPLQGAMRDSPAVGEFFLSHAIPFHVFLHSSNSVWLRPNEGVKENARQVSWLRNSAHCVWFGDGGASKRRSAARSWEVPNGRNPEKAINWRSETSALVLFCQRMTAGL